MEVSRLWVRRLSSDPLLSTSRAGPFVPQFLSLEPGQSNALFPHSRFFHQGCRAKAPRPWAPCTDLACSGHLLKACVQPFVKGGLQSGWGHPRGLLFPFPGKDSFLYSPPNTCLPVYLFVHAVSH